MNQINMLKIGNDTNLGLFDKQVQTQSGSFMTVLESAIRQTNELQLISDQYAEKLATGQVENLHEVIIAGQKADISLQMLTAVRSTVMDAYREIMRMQI